MEKCQGKYKEEILKPEKSVVGYKYARKLSLHAKNDHLWVMMIEKTFSYFTPDEELNEERAAYYNICQ